MTEQLQELVDKEAIREAMLRYCRGVDRGDAELIASAYHPDAVDEHGGAHFEGAAIGPGLVELVSRSRISQHQVTNQLIRLQEGRQAVSETYFTAWQASGEEGEERMLLALGRYLDRFEERDGEWRIAHRQVVVEHVRLLSPDGIVPPTGRLHGSRDRDDPSYHLF